MPVAAHAQTLPGVALDAPVVEGPTVVAEAPDFATETYADPWDYANRQDIQLDAGPVLNLTNVRRLSGRLAFTAEKVGHLALVWPGYPGALYVGRDGPARPVDADRYTHAAIRLHASRQAAGSLFWDRCVETEGGVDLPGAAQDPCRGTAAFTIPAGWSTVVVDLPAASVGQHYPWRGAVFALRMSVGPLSATDVTLDWVRLFQPTGETVVRWPSPVRSGDRPELIWDADADLANNTDEAPGWGSLGPGSPALGGGLEWIFPTSAYPPGHYHFAVRTAGRQSAYSEPLEIAPAPVLGFLAPHPQGGEDAVTAATGDPWDFAQPTDVLSLHNVNDVAWDNDTLHATNAPPQQNDPHFYLRMPAGGIDPERYRWLTIRTTYDGPFGLADEPGGGMHGRWSWRRADMESGDFHVPATVLQSKEVVTYSDISTYTVDMRTDPPALLMEDDLPYRVGWTGSNVTALRWDANEDRGPRRWRVHEVALRADPETRGGRFEVAWRDLSPQHADRPTAVSLHATSSAPPAGRSAASLHAAGKLRGQRIAAGLRQRDGRGSYVWDTRGVPPGRYWLWAEAESAGGTSRWLASAPVQVHPEPARLERIAGRDRIETALALSRHAFPDGAPAAVIARSSTFPDALAAGPLAHAAGGPLLLNTEHGLHAGVAAELARLRARKVYLVGSEGAQGPAVEAALRTVPGLEVIRLGGPDRYDTAARVALEAAAVWRRAGHADAGRAAIVTLGTDFPDALAATQLAGHSRQPVLLTERHDLPEATGVALSQLGTRRPTVVGGTAAVSVHVEGLVHERTGRVVRIGGRNRYETAVLLAAAAVEAGADDTTLVAASGVGFADALAAGPAALARGGTLLLTDREGLPAPAREWVAMRAERFGWLAVAGGPAAVSARAAEALARTARAAT